MTYSPLDPGTLVPGLMGNRHVTQLMASLDAAYELYQVPLLNTRCSLSTSSASAELVADFAIPGNLDNRDIQLVVLWRGTTGQTAELKFVVDDGSNTDEDTITSTTTSYGTGTLTLPLVNTTGPLRYGQIYLNVTGGQVVHVAHVLCLIPKLTTFPDGPRPSGAAKLDGWDLSATGGAWPSEVVQRMTGNIRAAARDLRACLVSGLHKFGAVAGSGLPSYEVSGTEFGLVERFLWPGGDPDRRKYRVALKLAGDEPRVRLQLGPYDVTASALGWNHELPTFFAPQGSQAFVWVRSNNGGTARLETFQIFREPA